MQPESFANSKNYEIFVFQKQAFTKDQNNHFVCVCIQRNNIFKVFKIFCLHEENCKHKFSLNSQRKIFVFTNFCKWTQNSQNMKLCNFKFWSKLSGKYPACCLMQFLTRKTQSTPQASFIAAFLTLHKAPYFCFVFCCFGGAPYKTHVMS